eukprot:TRINITY_DN20617_c0_g1_i1.p1 TRINITY_DN20617_c0_g1~~TRINITY_DN20617_c0_g1_i1.p1  ORF type:complete len:688 (+),score=123.44 TRINITY_DN20617_c0_g1_i1:167-2230(+)
MSFHAKNLELFRMKTPEGSGSFSLHQKGSRSNSPSMAASNDRPLSPRSRERLRRAASAGFRAAAEASGKEAAASRFAAPSPSPTPEPRAWSRETSPMPVLHYSWAFDEENGVARPGSRQSKEGQTLQPVGEIRTEDEFPEPPCAPSPMVRFSIEEKITEPEGPLELIGCSVPTSPVMASASRQCDEDLATPRPWSDESSEARTPSPVKKQKVPHTPVGRGHKGGRRRSVRDSSRAASTEVSGIEPPEKIRLDGAQMIQCPASARGPRDLGQLCGAPQRGKRNTFNSPEVEFAIVSPEEEQRTSKERPPRRSLCDSVDQALSHPTRESSFNPENRVFSNPVAAYTTIHTEENLPMLESTDKHGVLDGRWVHKDRPDTVEVIEDGAVRSQDGTVKDFTLQGDNKILMEVHNSLLRGSIDQNGHILWADGQVWIPEAQLIQHAVDTEIEKHADEEVVRVQTAPGSQQRLESKPMKFSQGETPASPKKSKSGRAIRLKKPKNCPTEENLDALLQDSCESPPRKSSSTAIAREVDLLLRMIPKSTTSPKSVKPVPEKHEEGVRVMGVSVTSKVAEVQCTSVELRECRAAQIGTQGDDFKEKAHQAPPRYLLVHRCNPTFMNNGSWVKMPPLDRKMSMTTLYKDMFREQFPGVMDSDALANKAGGKTLAQISAAEAVRRSATKKVTPMASTWR